MKIKNSLSFYAPQIIQNKSIWQHQVMTKMGRNGKSALIAGVYNDTTTLEREQFVNI